MHSLTIDINAVIEDQLKKAHDPALRLVVCESQHYGDICVLNRDRAETYFWSVLNRSYAAEDFGFPFPSSADPKDLIRAALIAGRQIFLFDTLTEFCIWYLERFPVKSK